MSLPTPPYRRHRSRSGAAAGSAALARSLALLAVSIGVISTLHAAEPARYELTITNTNTGQNFSPPVIVIHDPQWQMFELGEPASEPLWRLAEDGAAGGFRELAAPGVDQVLVGQSVHRRNSPVYSTVIEALPDRLVSVAAMLTLTNDGFMAAQRLALPRAAGESATVPLLAYDAGSEANTESCDHVPCEVHGQRMTEGAEGTVREHPGIRGDVDIPERRGWQDPKLGQLTVTRLPEPG
ncbi:MAG: spondin domain-containing protein [Pseudomonadota bacterium]